MAVSMEYESKIALSVVKCEMLRSTYYINLRFSMHVYNRMLSIFEHIHLTR